MDTEPPTEESEIKEIAETAIIAKDPPKDEETSSEMSIDKEGESSEENKSTGGESTAKKIIGILWYIVGKLKLKQIFQPPIIASALAIIIGTIPFLKNFILTDDAPLFFFTDSCLILGEAMIPCILLALGGNLVDGSGPGSKRLGLRTTAIIFGRLVLVPPTGLGIITIADKLGLFPRGDKMFKFVLLLQHTMPERYVQHLCHHHLYAIYSGEMT
ncbi:protein PIN-LIKES 6-like [Zingiber officinale]|uniref:protein PIN-LIKES 6-like n=1 Tax=Zingiber officinale TaxID=94328 RepID=UPI001C4D9DBC|nr:protein PIN-LIKES 6-like [Zingiber officinale]